jgi:hypothetical protein
MCLFGNVDYNALFLTSLPSALEPFISIIKSIIPFFVFVRCVLLPDAQI